MGRNPSRIAQILGEFFSKFFAFSFFFVVVNPVSPTNKRRYLYKKKTSENDMVITLLLPTLLGIKLQRFS